MFLILCTILTFLPPFLFAYYADGYWMKEGSYSEQAHVNCSGKYILIVGSTGTVKVNFSSSYGSLNRNFQDALIPGKITCSFTDTNKDNIPDQISVTIEVLFTTVVSASPTINSVSVWLIFDNYQLRARQNIYMETMALINLYPPEQFLTSSNPIVTTAGELLFQQRKPIQSSGSFTEYNQSIINIDDIFTSSSINLNPILDKYFTRTYYTSYQSQYEKWLPSVNANGNKLTINILLNNGKQSIRFIPGFWQEFKWGWIQYVCVLLPFIMVFNRIKEFVFRNQLVRTLVELPHHRHKD